MKMPLLTSCLYQSNCLINLMYLTNQRSICVSNFVWQRFICLVNAQFKLLVNPDVWMHGDQRPSQTNKNKQLVSWWELPDNAEFTIKVTYVPLQFMWLNCSFDDDVRWLPPRLLNVNQCQSSYQIHKHHHRVSHAKRPTTPPITTKTF